MSLVAEDVTVSYLSARHAAEPAAPHGRQRLALAGVTVRLEHGECVAVVGPNGAGKSTLVRVLSGQLRPTAGAVVVDGVPLASLGRFALARRVAVVEQNPVLPAGFTANDVVAMGRTPHLGLFGSLRAADHGAISAAMAATGTLELARRPVETLSGGESQRVVLARALTQGAGHLLLDEPTNHLDLRYQVEVLSFARRAVASGTAVMLVLHDLNLAARASDRVVMLAGGRVVADGPPAAVLTADVITEVYQTAVTVVYDDGVPLVVPRIAGR